MGGLKQMNPYLKPTNYSGGRGSSEPPFKERVVIFLVALMPLAIAILLHNIF